MPTFAPGTPLVEVITGNFDGAGLQPLDGIVHPSGGKHIEVDMIGGIPIMLVDSNVVDDVNRGNPGREFRQPDGRNKKTAR